MEAKKKINFSEFIIIDRINETIEVLSQLKEFVGDIELAAQMVLNCFRSGNKLLICGNGGSAADAQHIAAEFMGKFYRLDRTALPAIALHTNTSILTALANDFGFEGIYRRQVEALGQKGDILLAISTSGNSENIIEAAKMAVSRKMDVISLTGANECELDEYSDLVIKVPSSNTPIIQNAHIAVCHTICELVESHY